MSRPSWSSAIYERLLALYPREIWREHRAEMLQNFDDLERTSSSTIALWLVLGRDLVTSVGSYWVHSVMGARKSFARQSSIVVAVLAFMVAMAWRRHGEHEAMIWAFCGGYAIGWVSGWSRRREAVVLTLVGIALSISAGQPFLLTAYYGCILGWVAGWVGSVRAAAGPPRRSENPACASALMPGCRGVSPLPCARRRP